jgi:lysophospholipase L1-like esterase
VRNRLPAQLDRLRPDVVLVWCGVNDVWNRLEEDLPPGSLCSPVQSFVTGLRLTRLARVWLQSEEIEQQQDIAGHSFGDRPRFSLVPGAPTGGTTVDWGDRVEELHFRDMGRRSDDDAGRIAAADYDAIVTVARAHAVPIAFVNYPLAFPIFSGFNKAMAEVGRRRGVPVIDSVRALDRVPKERRTWVFMAHPGPAIYAEIARDVAATVKALAPPPDGTGGRQHSRAWKLPPAPDSLAFR